MKRKDKDWFCLLITFVVTAAALGTALYGFWVAACLTVLQCH